MYWLLKAEPDSRVVKGKDVKFSVEDFETIKTTPWEGVRNFEARNLMKEMKVGEKALFYHSNCKNPGVAAFAEVSKEAYPDYTSWDESHPYFDVKSKESGPTWYMVDLTFVSRAKHFVPLSLFKHIATLSDAEDSEIPEEIAYIGKEGIKAIKGMALINRGRLSVQRVAEQEWNTINLLAERGGWDELLQQKPKAKKSSPLTEANGEEKKAPSRKQRSAPAPKKASSRRTTSRPNYAEEDYNSEDEASGSQYNGEGDDSDEYTGTTSKKRSSQSPAKKGAAGRARKRKVAGSDGDEDDGDFRPSRAQRRKSTRN